MRQDLSWALARSPGPRSRAWARLASFWEAGLFLPLYGVGMCSSAPANPGPSCKKMSLSGTGRMLPRAALRAAAARPGRPRVSRP